MEDLLCPGCNQLIRANDLIKGDFVAWMFHVDECEKYKKFKEKRLLENIQAISDSFSTFEQDGFTFHVKKIDMI